MKKQIIVTITFLEDPKYAAEMNMQTDIDETSSFREKIRAYNALILTARNFAKNARLSVKLKSEVLDDDQWAGHD